MTVEQRLPGWVYDLIAATAVLLGGGILLGLGLGGFGLGGFSLMSPGGGGSWGGGFDSGGGSGAPRGPGGGPVLTARIVAPHIAGAVLSSVTAALMFVRRHLPLVTFIATIVCLGIAVALSVPSLGPGIGAAIAAYGLAYRRSRILSFALAGSIGLIIVILSFFDLGRLFLDARVGAGLVIAAALGDSARSRKEYLAAAWERAARAELTRESEASRRVSEERLRIARELHDTVAHQLSVINLHAGAAAGAIEARPERVQEALGTIRQAARDGIAEIGELLRYLRDDEEVGVAPVAQGLGEVDALVERMRENGLAVESMVAGELGAVSTGIGAVAYRIVQEGLTNAHKYGGGSAELRLEVWPEELRIALTNPMNSSDTREAPAPSTGFGLVGIRERAALAHGTVSAGAEGGEFRLDVRLPFHAREAVPGQGSPT